MAAAGARARQAAPAAGTGRPGDTLRNLSFRPARKNSVVVTAAVLVLLAAGGAAALASFSQSGGHHAGSRLGPSATPHRSNASPAPPAAVSRPSPVLPAAPHRAPAAGSPKVVGVGCPADGTDSVTFDNAPAGPGWMPAGGGWTGNGCDGSTLWTMDPHGHQPAPSTMTWRFSPAGAARCTLAVFVPTQNALGVSDYSVSVGPTTASRVVAAVAVRQSTAAGRWLTLGVFPASGFPLVITAAPGPGSSGPGSSGPGHHGAIAASAARALCTA